ncbi:MAG: hypothetical protein WBS22_03410 [Methylocystis sp.]
MRHRLLAATALVATLSIGATTGAYAADPSIWVSDSQGNIGLVDTVTGGVSQVNNTGHVLTDIGFVGTQLYGATFTDLYSVSTATGAATHIGAFPGGGGGMNALVGNGTGLLGASNADMNLYSINPATAATSVLKTGLPGTSAGDLAFAGGVLYASEIDGATGLDMLVNATTGTKIADFTGTVGGPANAVFGLAFTGGTMYAVQGTEVYSVNLLTAALAPLSNYGGHGLVDAFGAAVVGESAPGPVPGTGLTGLVLLVLAGVAARSRGLFAR